MRLFYFELKKFIKNPKNKICLILLFVSIVGIFIFNQVIFNQNSTEIALNTAKINLQQSQQAIANIKQEIKHDPTSQELVQSIVDAQAEHDMLSEQVTALEKNDFAAFVQLDYQLNKASLKKITKKNSDEYRELAARISYYELVKAVKGEPGIFVNDTKESAFVVGRSIVAWLSSTTLFILFTVLLADNISHEIESSQIRFHQLLGGKESKYIFIKLIIPVMVVFFATVFSFVLLYIAQGIIEDFGTWEYPYLLPNRTILPIWKISLNTLYCFFVSLVFLTSLGQLLSFIFKKSLITVGLISVCITAFMTFSREEWFQPFKRYLPFEYMGYGQIINDMNLLPKHALEIGVIYLLGLSLIFLIISDYLYKGYYYRKGG